MHDAVVVRVGVKGLFILPNAFLSVIYCSIHHFSLSFFLSFHFYISISTSVCVSPSLSESSEAEGADTDEVISGEA